MTDEQLQAIKARAEAATPAPWTGGRNTSDEGLYIISHDGQDDEIIVIYSDGGVAYRDDATFIAYAREDVPALVAEVERLRAQLDAVPVEEICRLMYDCQTVDDERVIVAWAQANDPQREAA